MLPTTSTTAAAASPLTRKVPLVAAARDALLAYRKGIPFYFQALELSRLGRQNGLLKPVVPD